MAVESGFSEAAAVRVVAGHWSVAHASLLFVVMFTDLMLQVLSN